MAIRNSEITPSNEPLRLDPTLSSSTLLFTIFIRTPSCVLAAQLTSMMLSGTSHGGKTALGECSHATHMWVFREHQGFGCGYGDNVMSAHYCGKCDQPWGFPGEIVQRAPGVSDCHNNQVLSEEHLLAVKGGPPSYQLARSTNLGGPVRPPTTGAPRGTLHGTVILVFFKMS